MQTMKSLRKYGLKFYEEAVEGDNDAYLVAKRLVENLFSQLSKLSTKYCNETFCDMPYTYTERRLDSVLLPVLSKICDAKVLTEYPVSRSQQDDQSAGRIDYWCIYEGYSFVIELKQSYDNIRTPRTKKDKLIERWQEMITQLDSIKKDVKEFEEQTNGVIRLGLHVITSRDKEENDNGNMKPFAQMIDEIAQRLRTDLSKATPRRKPDMLICWQIPQDIVEQSAKWGLVFPGLWMVAKIYPQIQHKGMKLA